MGLLMDNEFGRRGQNEPTESVSHCFYTSLWDTPGGRLVECNKLVHVLCW
jgi:hypothetical protein